MTIGLAPAIDIGPVSFAWHGITTAAGLPTPRSDDLKGSAFYGVGIVRLPVAAVTLGVNRQPVLAYLDRLAVGLLAGMVPGRVGDSIGGEHSGPGPPTDLPWGVFAAYALGRFASFFEGRNVDVAASRLRQAQWTSLGLVGVAALGAFVTTAPDGPAGSFGRRHLSGVRSRVGG